MVTDIVERLERMRGIVAERLGPAGLGTLDEVTAEIERLREALRLARNRLQRLALEGNYKRRLETAEWAKEATAALEGRSDD